jgi:hypothetical protein
MRKGSSSPFRVPKYDVVPKPGEGCDAKAIRAWVEALPTANVGHTARELYLKLKWLNRLAIPPAERLQALSLMQPVALYVLDSLAAHYAQEHLPLTERNRLIAELARDLMSRMVVGYKIVFRQLVEEDASFIGRLFHGGVKAEALYGALYYLGRLLLHAYRLYQDVPSCTWQEIHATYHWAEERDLQSKRLRNDAFSPGKKTTITGLYIQLLLLSLAGPYRLFHGEAERIHVTLDGWTGKCRLIPFGEAVSEEVKFAVFRTLDAPPAFRERLGQQEGLQGWYLDTRELSAMLAEQLEGEQNPGAPAKHAPHLQSSTEQITVELKRRLMLAWGMGFKRHDKRAREAGRAQVAVGLESVFALMGGVGESLITDTGIGVKVVSELSPEEEAQLQNNALAKAEWQLSEGNIDIAQDVFDRTARDRRIQKRLKWVSEVCVEVSEVLDKSPHGYHFIWSGSQRMTPQVGEVVGVGDSAEFNDETAWKIGVVRWLRDSGGEHFEFGVEVVAEAADPVMLWYLPHDSDIREEFCSLLVPLQGGDKAVMVPTFYPHEQDKVFLVREDNELPIRFTQLLEYTGYFTKYRFGPLTDQEAEKEGDKEDDFKDLWQEL